jgi:hypothetical protein
MKNLSPAKFPQKRLDQMEKDAKSFDYRGSVKSGVRIDAMTDRSMALLQSIDPVLAYKIVAGLRIDGHKDAAENLFFARQLEYIRPGLLEVLYPDLEAKKFFPFDSGPGPGAEQFTYRFYNKVGRAQLIKSYSNDPPRVDVSGQEATQQIQGAADMYGYTTQELRNAMQAQMPLDQRKAMSARYALALLFDEVAFYGHADITAVEQTAAGLDAGALEGKLKGMVNLSGTTAFTTPNGASGSKLWRRKTADEIVIDMHSFVNGVVKATFGIHRPDTMLLPLAAYNIAATRRMGDGSNQTCLDFFLATSPYVKEVNPTYRLDQARSANWGGTTGRAMVYEKNPERFQVVVPLEFEQFAPQQTGFEIRTICHGRIASAVPYYPGSISYMDGITDSAD